MRIARVTMAMAVVGLVLAASSAHAQKKPNILMIMADDVGIDDRHFQLRKQVANRCFPCCDTPGESD